MKSSDSLDTSSSTSQLQNFEVIATGSFLTPQEEVDFLSLLPGFDVPLFESRRIHRHRSLNRSDIFHHSIASILSQNSLRSGRDSNVDRVSGDPFSSRNSSRLSSRSRSFSFGGKGDTDFGGVPSVNSNSPSISSQNSLRSGRSAVYSDGSDSTDSISNHSIASISSQNSLRSGRDSNVDRVSGDPLSSRNSSRLSSRSRFFSFGGKGDTDFSSVSSLNSNSPFISSQNSLRSGRSAVYSDGLDSTDSISNHSIASISSQNSLRSGRSAVYSDGLDSTDSISNHSIASISSQNSLRSGRDSNVDRVSGDPLSSRNSSRLSSRSRSFSFGGKDDTDFGGVPSVNSNSPSISSQNSLRSGRDSNVDRVSGDPLSSRNSSRLSSRSRSFSFGGKGDTDFGGWSGHGL